MVLFMRENHPGALLEILEQFASRGVDLCRIESRPTKRTLGDYCFSVDAEGHIDDARLAEAMMGLHRICADVIFLGSYPRADAAPATVKAGTSNADYAAAVGWLRRLQQPARLSVFSRFRRPRSRGQFVTSGTNLCLEGTSRSP